MSAGFTSAKKHAELAGYRLEVREAIREPERIVAGNAGERLGFEVSKMANALS
jgi:hypothetical protein